MKTLKFTFSTTILFAFLLTSGQIYSQIKSPKNVVTVHDIQYTTDPYGDSPLVGDSVTVFGIVTSSAKDYDLGYVYIQDEGGGPWSGIFIYGPGLNQFYRGEEIMVFGKVVEDFGTTYLSIKSAELTGRYVEIVATDIDITDSTSYIGNGWEKWESVLVRYKDPGGAKLYISDPKVQNYGDYGVSVVGKKLVKRLGLILAGRQTTNYYSSLWVQIVADSLWFDNSGQMNVPPIETATWMEMDAVVGQMFYSYNDYHLCPRNNDDFINTNVTLEPTYLPVSPLAAISEINQNDFKVFPNPASDIIHIVSESGPINQYQLYDIQGRLLAHKIENSERVEINVSDLNDGMYMVVIRSGQDKVQSVRVYVAR